MDILAVLGAYIMMRLIYGFIWIINHPEWIFGGLVFFFVPLVAYCAYKLYTAPKKPPSPSDEPIYTPFSELSSVNPALKVGVKKPTRSSAQGPMTRVEQPSNVDLLIRKVKNMLPERTWVIIFSGVLIGLQIAGIFLELKYFEANTRYYSEVNWTLLAPSLVPIILSVFAFILFCFHLAVARPFYRFCFLVAIANTVFYLFLGTQAFGVSLLFSVLGIVQFGVPLRYIARAQNVPTSTEAVVR